MSGSFYNTCGGIIRLTFLLKETMIIAIVRIIAASYGGKNNTQNGIL